MTGQKVLIAVDGSDHSEKAFQWYIDNLFKEGDTVILGHIAESVVQPTYAFRAGLALPKEEWQAMLKDREEKIKKIKQKFASVLQSNKIPYKFIHEEGDPGHHLTKIAEKESVTLVVLGTRGLGTVRRTVLGSVSDYLLHHANTQVCIFRE